MPSTSGLGAIGPADGEAALISAMIFGVRPLARAFENAKGVEDRSGFATRISRTRARVLATICSRKSLTFPPTPATRPPGPPAFAPPLLIEWFPAPASHLHGW